MITLTGMTGLARVAAVGMAIAGSFLSVLFVRVLSALVPSALAQENLIITPPAVVEDWRILEVRTRPATLPLVSDTGLETGPGALDPEHLAQPRPAPAFDLTGVWAFRGFTGADYEVHGHYNFSPLPKFTPKGQAFYDEYRRFEAAGKRHLEPSASCHPAGLPRLQTRYGSLMLLQYPTAIYKVSRLNNEYRTVFLDGRPRVDAAIRERNYLGESGDIGRAIRWSSKPKVSSARIT